MSRLVQLSIEAPAVTFAVAPVLNATRHGIAILSLAVAVIAAPLFVTPALAAGGAVKSPTGVAPDRYVYYPGTEELKEDELRLFACGTGMPAARRDQAATCWLVELGNGDKFFFDIGTGSMPNIAALRQGLSIPPAYRSLG